MAAEGSYKCQTKDDKTECELTVYMKNKFLKELENVTVNETESATFECQMADADAKVVWYHKGDRILEGIDEKYDVKVLGNGVHQLVVLNCQTLDIAEVSCTCVNLKTVASLDVKKKESKPEVSADDQESADGAIKGRFRGKRTFNIKTYNFHKDRPSRTGFFGRHNLIARGVQAFTISTLPRDVITIPCPSVIQSKTKSQRCAPS